MVTTLPPQPPGAAGWPASGLPLAIWGARHHPDALARRTIAVALARWAGLEPEALQANDTRWSLPRVRPQVVAPVVVEPPDRADAAALARLLFSSRIAGSRLRVASRDALLGQYGLTVTATGRGYVSPRDLHRVPRRAEQAVAYLQPRALTGALDHLSTTGRPAAHVSSSVSSTGVSVTARGVRWPETGSALAAQLEQSSSVRTKEGRPLSFAQLGLVVRVERGAVQVRPRTGEATIKLTALMARGALLTITPGPREDGAPVRLVARLAPPASRGTRLAAVASDAVPEVDAWLRIRWPGEPTLPLDLRVLLARHLPVHDTWLDSKLIDAMLDDSWHGDDPESPRARGFGSREDPA